MVNQTVESTGALWRNIGAGKSKPFIVEVRSAPELLKTAVVTFAAKHAAKPRLGVGAFCGGLGAALSFQRSEGVYFDNPQGERFPPVYDGYPG
jgi:hypothetical protein